MSVRRHVISLAKSEQMFKGCGSFLGVCLLPVRTSFRSAQGSGEVEVALVDDFAVKGDDAEGWASPRLADGWL